MTFCWRPGSGDADTDTDTDTDTDSNTQPVYGYCRQCDGLCPGGEVCDYGWCRNACAVRSDCAPDEFCTSNVCRPPASSTEFMLENIGDDDLAIYCSRTEVHGGDDACAFASIEWKSDDDTILIAPGESTLLRINFTPSAAGEFRALIHIFSNAKNMNPLPIVMCGKGVEAVCDISIDGTCPDCMSCMAEDFEDYEHMTPDCAGSG